MEKTEAATASHDVAVRIYVELVARHTEIAQGSVKMSASAANLAKLSLQLADEFVKARQEAVAAKAPVTSYKLDATDIAQWSK